VLLEEARDGAGVGCGISLLEVTHSVLVLYHFNELLVERELASSPVALLVVRLLERNCDHEVVVHLRTAGQFAVVERRVLRLELLELAN
jgi:hypothetical protein